MKDKENGIIVFLLCKKTERGSGLNIFKFEDKFYQANFSFTAFKAIPEEFLCNGFRVAKVKFQRPSHINNKNPYEFLGWI